jgi:hypothetical protein
MQVSVPRISLVSHGGIGRSLIEVQSRAMEVLRGPTPWPEATAGWHCPGIGYGVPLAPQCLVSILGIARQGKCRPPRVGRSYHILS